MKSNRHQRTNGKRLHDGGGTTRTSGGVRSSERARSCGESVRLPRVARHQQLRNMMLSRFETRHPPPNPAAILDKIRGYLLEGFPQVTVVQADAKTGTALIHVINGRARRVVEITNTFLDANAAFPNPVEALRRWDLIKTLKDAESGSIVRVTTSGLRFV